MLPHILLERAHFDGRAPSSIEYASPERTFVECWWGRTVLLTRLAHPRLHL